MRSYPYNVIVSKSLRDIRNMFFGLGLTKAKLSNYLDPNFSRKLKDTIIVSQRDNKGFIEMEFDRAFSQKKFQVMLKFVETSEILEFFAFTNDPVEGLIKDRILTELHNTTTDEARNKIVGQFGDYLNSFYLAFGVGDNINNWTGPLRMSLTNAHLSIREDGIREVELIFTPDANSYKLYHNMNLASLARTRGTDGYGEVATSTYITTATQAFSHDGVKPINNSSGYGWNYHMRQLVRKYLSQIYTNIPIGNILPLFSKDLDRPGETEDAAINLPSFGNFRNIEDLASVFKTFGLVLTQESEDTKTTTSPLPESTKKIMESKGFAQDPKNPSQASPAASPANSKQDLIQSLIDNPNELIPFDKGLSDTDRTYIVQQRAKRREKGGLSLDSSFSSSAYRPVEGKDSFVKQKTMNGLNKDILDDIVNAAKVISLPSNTNIDSAQETDKDTSSERKPGTAKLTMRSVVDGNKGSVTDALHNFSKALIDTGEQTTDIILIEEPDLFILESLKESGLIIDETIPVILFGEREIIRSLVYSLGKSNKDGQVSGVPPTINVVVSYEDAPVEEMVIAWESHLDGIFGRFGDRGNTSCYGEQPAFDRLSVRQDFNKDLITFAHNTKNSNILNIELDDKVFFSHFKNLLIDSEVRTHAVNVKAAQILKNSQVTLQEIVDYLKVPMQGNSPSEVKFDLIRKLYDTPDDKLIKLIKSNQNILEIDTLDFVDIVTFMLTGKGATDLLESVGTVKVVPHNVSRAYADLVSELRRLTRGITIKTLPFFNHGSRLFNSDCFVYALGNSIKGATAANQIVKTPTFFSGGYKIMGYRHVITTKDVYSEFKLVKSDSPISELFGAYVPKPLKDFLKDKITLISIDEAVRANQSGSLQQGGIFKADADRNQQPQGGIRPTFETLLLDTGGKEAAINLRNRLISPSGN